ncbi:hypothetical protein [Nostoc sp. PA-18-2419]|uniref:hypothetical protein n=1 Tax=Nostoc sp. PA-18-2419 TaxID=2575443 RepID=UPI0011084970|nr:hypothetical protein [Nostoc sp. PA-18-2419]
MNTKQYKSELDKSIFLGSGQQQKIAELLAQVETNTKLSDDDKLEIETYARSINVVPASKELPHDKGVHVPDERRKLFPRYEFDDALEFPDGLKEYSFDENCNDVAKKYGTWLLEKYLPTFHPMPNQEHQHPIAVCLMLLNCKAVLSQKQCIPIPYFLGMNGSGKTELAKAIGQHYPKTLYIEFRPNNTGAAIRDTLDNYFGNGEPGFALFDNLNPRTALDRWGSHYDSFLANCEESAYSRISTNGNDSGSAKSLFKTYCYKAFTSVWGLEDQSAGEFGEIARRCIVLRFQQSKPFDTRTIYDWEGQQRIFQRIWGEEFVAHHRKDYGKLLGQLARLKPNEVPIDGKVWIICQVPIAVGVYCGVFANINEGIAHFARHFEYLKKGGSSAVGSALSIVLSKYVKEDLPRLAQEQISNPFASKKGGIVGNVIAQKDLIDHVTDKTGFQVSKQQFDEVIMLMNNLGYVYARVGTGMGFVRDNTLSA